MDCSVLDPRTTRPGRFQPSSLRLRPCTLSLTQQRPCLAWAVVPPGNRSRTGAVQLLITRMLLLPSRPGSSELRGHGRAWLRGTFITETAPIGTSRVAATRSKASRHTSSLECSRLDSRLLLITNIPSRHTACHPLPQELHKCPLAAVQ